MQKEMNSLWLRKLYIVDEFQLKYITMSDRENESLAGPRIEKLRASKGNEVGFSTERGGLITSLKLNGVDVFYMNEDTFNNLSGSVRGGVPDMFPNAGPLIGSGHDFPELKQHGFARKSSGWKKGYGPESGFSMQLLSDEETKKQFPYDFDHAISGEFKEDGSFTISQSVTNTETDKEMPVSMGLHPYFKVPNERRRDIKFDFPGGDQFASRFEEWSEGQMVSVDNPKGEDPNAVLRIEIPDLGVLVFDVSKEYQKIWIWSEPGADFVCIEPVMRNPNGLVDDPEMIKPGETFTASLNIKLER